MTARDDGVLTGVARDPVGSPGRVLGSEPFGRATPIGPEGAFVPHIVAWNLTRRCNLACSHCYIAAGSWHAEDSELSTEACLRILDQILAANPAPMLILTGGEPLLRDDLEGLAERASSRGATVVVGTNGTRLTDDRIGTLMAAGVSGVALSVDSLDATYHDRFRHGGGALDDTLAAVDRLAGRGLDFVVQTTVTRGNRHELDALVAWAAERGAVCFNLYFLVPTGRGTGMRGMSPEENEETLGRLLELETEYRGRIMVRSKCQPQIMRHVVDGEGDSTLLNYETRCPCGIHYCRITPEGKVTPCPYMPLIAGDLATDDFGSIWAESPVFQRLRSGALGGRCGRCEYRKVCGGCRARAYADSGDPLGPDDSCVYDPTGEEPVIEPRALTYGSGAGTELDWTPEARERLNRIPSFVRSVVADRLETFAKAHGRDRVDVDLMAEVRRSMPLDFSKRLPFFLRKDHSA